MEIQIRNFNGEILLFQNVSGAILYHLKNKGCIAKMSFTTVDGKRHRFVEHETGGVFDKCLYNICKKTFPINSFVFADIPLMSDLETFEKVERFSKEFKVDSSYGYNCVCVQDAFLERDFFVYLFEEENKFLECSCDCCKCNKLRDPEEINLMNPTHRSSCRDSKKRYSCSCSVDFDVKTQ